MSNTYTSISNELSAAAVPAGTRGWILDLVNRFAPQNEQHQTPYYAEITDADNLKLLLAGRSSLIFIELASAARTFEVRSYVGLDVTFTENSATPTSMVVTVGSISETFTVSTDEQRQKIRALQHRVAAAAYDALGR